jgi:hypothetical protein
VRARVSGGFRAGTPSWHPAYDGPVRIDRLDHLVLTVADIDATMEFYTGSWACGR